MSPDIEEVEIPVPKSFCGFDPRDEVRIYQRNLPHWRQPGATYFVTFRLADSIPETVWEEMKTEAESWSKIIEKAAANHGGRVPDSLEAEYREFRKKFES